MVVRLIGNVNGYNIIFNRVKGDWWDATVPSSFDGKYIIDMQAYDEAGNMAYWAKYILTVDFSSLYVKLEKYPYYVNLDINDYNIDIFSKSYNAVLINNDINFDIKGKKYYATIIESRCVK